VGHLSCGDKAWGGPKATRCRNRDESLGTAGAKEGRSAERSLAAAAGGGEERALRPDVAQAGKR